MIGNNAQQIITTLIDLKTNMLIAAERKNKHQLVKRLQNELNLMNSELESISNRDVLKKINTVYSEEVEKIVRYTPEEIEKRLQNNDHIKAVMEIEGCRYTETDEEYFFKIATGEMTNENYRKILDKQIAEMRQSHPEYFGALS